jgi:hypothetical protein
MKKRSKDYIFIIRNMLKSENRNEKKNKSIPAKWVFG